MPDQRAGAAVFGAPVRRVEDPRLIRGAGIYVDDMRPAGLLHAAFLRSHLAHAGITRLDLNAAKSAPGVVAAWSARDLRNLKPMPVSEADGTRKPKRGPLAGDRVRHVGQAIAMVIAESLEAARDALDRIELELEPLPAVTDVEAAMRTDAPLLYPRFRSNVAFRIESKNGDIEGAFRDADIVIRQRLVNQRLIPMAMETRGAVASFQDGRLTLEVSNQAPYRAREQLAEVMELSERKIRVVVREVGGGFGSKGGIYGEEIAVAEAARRLGRPVKWIEDRSENCTATWQGRGQVQDVELTARRDGTILGIRTRILADMGAHLEGFTAVVPTSTPQLQTGCYRIPASQSTLYGVFTNTTPTGPYRGAGRPEAAYLIERMVDLLASELERDPADLRKQNFIPPSEFPYTNPGELTYDSGNYRGTLDRLLALADYSQLRRKQTEARSRGRLMGIGLSTYVELAAMGPADRGGARLEEDGSITVITGSTPHGQGHETTWGQVAARELALPADRIRVRHGDTDDAAYALGTWGSRSAAVSGSTVLKAAANLKKQIAGLAADALEAAPPDVVVEDGRAYVRGVPSRALTFQQIATWATQQGRKSALRARARFDPPDLVFPFGAHLAQVEVDRETGGVRLLRYIAVDDCGVVINPLIVEGQVHGGATQGIAQALFEAAVYDAAGQPLAANLVSYLVPGAPDLPMFETARTTTPTPRNPLGAKGIGEGGTTAAAPAVVNAVMDALRPLGIRHLDMPLSPAKIWHAIQDATS